MDSIEDISICSGGNNVEEDSNDNDTREVDFTTFKILVFKLQPSFQVIFNLRLEKCFCLSRNLLSACIFSHEILQNGSNLLSFKAHYVKNT